MNGAPTSSKFRVSGRDDGGGGGGLSTSTIVIIAVVCGCVAVLVLTLFLWRLLARCFRPKESVPLPPVQELAHHRREQQRAAFASTHGAPSRPGTWLDGSVSGRTMQSGSAVSLLTNPEKVPSIYTDEMTTAESTLPSPDGEDRLYPPNPSFYRNSDASSSHNTLADNASSSHNSPVSSSPSTPLSENVPTTSHATSHSRSQSRQPSVTRPPSSRVPSRGRPLSQVSDSPTSHSGFTTRSSSVIRGGPPHRSGSMQIVLPAPLGPQPGYAGDRPSLYNNQQISRSSVFADQWLTYGNESRNSSVEPTPDGRRPANSRSRSRHKQTSSVPAPPPNTVPPSSTFRRAASQQRSQTNLARLPEAPPGSHVPQSSYAGLAELAESNYDDDAARGRSRTTSNRLTRIQSGQVHE